MSGPPTDNNSQEITYFRCGEPAFLLLQRIVTDRAWLESLKSYTKFRYGNRWSIRFYMYYVLIGTLVCWNHSTVCCWVTLPKELPIGKDFLYIYKISDQIKYYRNEGYLVQLAVLDHNALRGRENALNHNDDIIYHRKYKKQTKKWDVTPTKSKKLYKHIPELMRAILEERKVSAHNLKHQVTLHQEHPSNIQATIAHIIPDATAQLVKNKWTRFT